MGQKELTMTKTFTLLPYLFICQQTLGLPPHFSYILWIMLLWTQVHGYLFKILFLILLCIYLDVEFLDHMGALFSVFWATSTLSSTATVLFYIPIQQCTKELVSPYTSQHLLFSGFAFVYPRGYEMSYGYKMDPYEYKDIFLDIRI